VNQPNLIPVLLLILLGVVLGGLSVMVVLILHWRRHGMFLNSSNTSSLQLFPSFHPPNVVFQHRPPVWLAIRSRNLHAVQTALGLSNPKPTTRTAVP